MWVCLTHICIHVPTPLSCQQHTDSECDGRSSCCSSSKNNRVTSRRARKRPQHCLSPPSQTILAGWQPLQHALLCGSCAHTIISRLLHPACPEVNWACKLLHTFSIPTLNLLGQAASRLQRRRSSQTSTKAVACVSARVHLRVSLSLCPNTT